jgi:hypothetical protein
MLVIYTLPASDIYHYHRSQHSNANFASDELHRLQPTAQIVAILGQKRR